MSTRLFTRIGAAAVVAAIALGALAASPASAQDGRIEKRGTCSAGSLWRLRGADEGSVLDIDIDVDSNTAGETWKVVLTDNGTTVFRGSRQTVAPSGDFSIERHITDLDGADVIRVKATNTVTGERCNGTITV